MKELCHSVYHKDAENGKQKRHFLVLLCVENNLIISSCDECVLGDLMTIAAFLETDSFLV